MTCCRPEPLDINEKDASRECPRCRQNGRSVERLTLEHLLREPTKISNVAEPFLFCATPYCDVVYFTLGGEVVFEKQDVKVRVGIKEKLDPIPVCYCYGHTRASVWHEIRETKKSTVVASIKAAVHDGQCECEIKNPSGNCCLGEVTRAVTQGFERFPKSELRLKAVEQS